MMRYLYSLISFTAYYTDNFDKACETLKASIKQLESSASAPHALCKVMYSMSKYYSNWASEASPTVASLVHVDSCICMY